MRASAFLPPQGTRSMQQGIGEDVHVQLQAVGQLVPSAAAAAGRVGGVVEPVGGVDEDEPAVLRRNWDAAMARLRKKLREARIRTDLVRADRTGNVELVLRRADRVEDQT